MLLGTSSVRGDLSDPFCFLSFNACAVDYCTVIIMYGVGITYCRTHACIYHHSNVSRDHFDFVLTSVISITWHMYEALQQYTVT